MDSAQERTVGTALVTLTLLVGAWGPVQAAAPAATPKPDLVITRGEIAHITDAAEEETWFVRDRGYELAWKARTNNVGGARAGKSVTGIKLFRLGKPPVVLDKLEVRRLRPDHAFLGTGVLTQRFRSVNWPFGTYIPQVCADIGNAVAEKNENNNCRDLTKNRLFIIPKAFDGLVTGEKQITEGVAETWTGEVRLILRFGNPRGDAAFGFFYYDVDDSSKMTYSVSGTDPNGCEWSGTGQTQGLNSGTGDTLSLSFGHEPDESDLGGLYGGHGEPPDSFNYTITQTCPGQDPQFHEGPTALCGADWFDTGNDDREFRDPGMTRLRGRFTEPSCGGPFTNKVTVWNLTAR